MAERIAAHRRRRPPEWSTVECGADLPGALAATAGTAIVDALGTWLARLEGFGADAGKLCDALRTRGHPTVLVSEEAGMGVHPATEAGRRFRDALGTLNRAVATVADDVLLVVAGRVLRLEPLDELQPVPSKGQMQAELSPRGAGADA
jgi:adenosylcobinamide kinase/adenosylcobinamide-phosphate guanylyltransferase